MKLSDRDHARLRSRLEAFAYGVLDPDAADEVRGHLDACAECRAFAASLAPSSPSGEPGGAHLPESLVVRWAREAPQLRGVQRELVRRHLERCDLCREDLRLLGHAAELPVVPELEASEDVLRLLVPSGDVPQRPDPSPLPRPRPSWFAPLLAAWPQTGWAVAATAMLAIVIANPSLVQRLPWSAPPALAPVPPAPSPVTGPSPSIASQPVVEPAELDRGGSPAVPTVTITPDAAVVVLHAAPPDVPLDSDVRVAVREPGGTVRVERTMRAGELTHGRVLALDLGRDARAGVDTLVVTGERNGLTKTARYVFEVRRASK